VSVLRKLILIGWLCACFVLLAGIFQIGYYSFTGNFLDIQPQSVINFLERWAILGFLIDALIIGLIFRGFIRWRERKRSDERVNP